MYQWGDQLVEIQKEKDDLANRKEVVGKESENSIISLLGEKGKEIKNWQVKIKKLSNKLNEGEMEEFIIDRNKSHQEIETQIDRLAEKFQELEQDQDTLSGENEFQEIEDLEIPPQESDDSAQVEIPPIINP